MLCGCLLEAHARELGIDQEDVGCDQGDVEKLPVLHLLGARSDPFDDDLARRRQCDDIAGREGRSGFRLTEVFATTDPMDEDAMLGHAGFGGRDRQSGERGVLIQPISAHLEFSPRGR